MDGTELARLAGAATAARTALAELAAVDLSAADPAVVAGLLPVLHEACVLADNAAALASRRVAVSGEWMADGSRSAAAWAARAAGCSHGQAQGRLSAARLAEEHPAFAPAFRSGATSVAHLRAIDEALTGPGSAKAHRRLAFPAFAEGIAAAAAAGDASDARRTMEAWCAAVDAHPEAAELQVFARRYLTITELMGECLIEGRLPLDDGRLLKRRLDALLDAHHRDPATSPLGRRHGPTPPAGEPHDDIDRADADPGWRTPRAALMADALLHLADLAAANPGAMPIVDGQPAQVIVIVPTTRLGTATARLEATGPPAPRTATSGKAPPSGPSPSRPASGERAPIPPPPQVEAVPAAPLPGADAARPPADLLTSGQPLVVPAAQVWSPGSPVPISDAAARRHACGDAEIRRLLVNPDGIADQLGRTTRILSRGLRVQIALRDGTCRYPACSLPAALGQVHHLHHWADGGTTDRTNLAALCGTHHRYLHEAAVVITGDPDQALTFTSKHGLVIGTTRPRPLQRHPWRLTA